MQVLDFLKEIRFSKYLVNRSSFQGIDARSSIDTRTSTNDTSFATD